VPEMPESAFTELAQYRAIASTPAEVTRKIADLEKDNQKERDKVRDLTEKAKALPPEGSVVLDAEAAKKHAAFEALGKTPEELGKLTGEVEELKTKDAARTRQDAFAGAVKALGWPEDTVTTLLDMKSLDGALVEVKTEKVAGRDGKQVDTPVPYVTLAGEGQKAQRFSEFVESAPQLKGIRTDAGNGNSSGGGFEGRTTPEQRGLPGKGGIKTEKEFAEATARTAQYDTF
jgi:hypothetical protein